MRYLRLAPVLALAAACDQAPPPAPTEIKVTSAEQQGLHKLDALNLAIALKRAIYDAGLTCPRVTDAGFVGVYENLDMWMANCAYANGAKRTFAVFAGPDGTAQVRDCADIGESGIPSCRISRRPAGNFDGSR